jgi:hypothetical protein
VIHTCLLSLLLSDGCVAVEYQQCWLRSKRPRHFTSVCDPVPLGNLFLASTSSRDHITTDEGASSSCTETKAKAVRGKKIVTVWMQRGRARLGCGFRLFLLFFPFRGGRRLRLLLSWRSGEYGLGVVARCAVPRVWRRRRRWVPDGHVCGSGRKRTGDNDLEKEAAPATGGSGGEETSATTSRRVAPSQSRARSAMTREFSDQKLLGSRLTWKYQVLFFVLSWNLQKNSYWKDTNVVQPSNLWLFTGRLAMPHGDSFFVCRVLWKIVLSDLVYKFKNCWSWSMQINL